MTQIKNVFKYNLTFVFDISHCLHIKGIICLKTNFSKLPIYKFYIFECCSLFVELYNNSEIALTKHSNDLKNPHRVTCLKNCYKNLTHLLKSKSTNSYLVF